MNSLKEKYQPYLESLDKLGFCTFKLFEDEVIKDLVSLYQNEFQFQNKEGLHASHNSNSPDFSIKISKSIESIVASQLLNTFPNYNYFIGHFMIKGAKTQNEFSLHQDWNIVDESKFNSYQIWIPLQLTYFLNGGLFLIPGSHKFFNNFRSGSYGIPMIPFDKKVNNVITDITVPPGNAVIYHNALFHGSYANKTEENRVAILLNIVEKNAPINYFHKNEKNACTELYKLTPNEFIKYLPHLEKGDLEATMSLEKTIQLSAIDNNSLTSDLLEKKFHYSFEKKQSQQIKQLHITLEDKLEDELNEFGFAVINLLDEETLNIFLEEYYKHFGQLDKTPGRFTTLQDTDSKMKVTIHNFILENIEKSLKKYFKDFTIPVSQFYTKKAFTSGDIDLHADSTLLINHQLEPHYAVWVPLVDVDATNGTLTVVPYSHKISRTLFASSLGGYHQEHIEWLRSLEIPLNLKAGQAVVFDNNLLHSSTSNKSSKDRVVFTFRITHCKSVYFSFFFSKMGDNESIAVSEENHNYYMDEKWDGNAPHITGKPIGFLKYGILGEKIDELKKKLI